MCNKSDLINSNDNDNGGMCDKLRVNNDMVCYIYVVIYVIVVGIA